MPETSIDSGPEISFGGATIDWINVGSDLVPAEGGTRELGQTSRRWNSIYVDRVFSPDIDALRQQIAYLQGEVNTLRAELSELRSSGK